VKAKGTDRQGIINQLELLAAGLRRQWNVTAVEPPAADGRPPRARRSSTIDAAAVDGAGAGAQ